MGNWNRRYLPRKKFRYYEYEDPPLSPARPYNNQSYSSGVDHNGVPSWEIDYCNSVRVPWRKVLASKKYIYCHPNVQNWDDSAGKEALQNAKQRYWATINGLPCDNPLPGPDIYIDEIDWDPHMDPQLMADLDLQFCDPDKVQNVEKLETINEGVEFAQSTNDNPWERDHVEGTGSLKEVAQGWSRWDDSVNLKRENPWEQNCSQLVDSSRDNVWKSGNESWGWHQGIDKSSAFVNYGRDNSCNYNRQTVDVRQKGWGQRENNSWGWGHGNAIDNSGYSCENNFSTGLKERGWRDNRNESWDWRESDYQGNEPKYWDSRSFRQGGRSFRGGGRKREGFQQHGSRYKSSRYHGDIYDDGRQL
ncbi:hypothetical protein DH2020_025752 [Rehmannia glutinosa]|uniref:Uncharacterized protein n=1 Tax=Rehmannia glutinosa TaxID=99300 RepID=A0ABR0W335_REHGL